MAALIYTRTHAHNTNSQTVIHIPTQNCRVAVKQTYWLFLSRDYSNPEYSKSDFHKWIQSEQQARLIAQHTKLYNENVTKLRGINNEQVPQNFCHVLSLCYPAL